MEQRQQPAALSIDLGLSKELEDRDFRNQFFRTEREIDIPAQIKSLRTLRGLKQVELAELAGTKQSAISRLERAQEAKWELETLVKLAEALDARLSVVIEPYESVASRYKAEEAQTTSTDKPAVAAFDAVFQTPGPKSIFRVVENKARTATNRSFKTEVPA